MTRPPATSPNDPAVRFFDSTAGAYQAKHYGDSVRSFMTVRQERVMEFVAGLGLPRGARVLDAGCGPGFLLAALAERGFRVSGVDAARGMIQGARARLEAAAPPYPAQLGLGSIERLPFRESAFDLVCSTGVIEYLQDDALALAEMHRVLRVGGYLVLSITNLWSPVNWLDFAVESAKRCAPLLRAFNSVWERLGRRPVAPRYFKVRRHAPGRFRAALSDGGFRLEDATYFHFLPWPGPFNQLFPGASARLGRRMERYGRSRIGPIAEGYLALASKRAGGQGALPPDR
jgi:SAM-dependent methyltransferase